MHRKKKKKNLGRIAVIPESSLGLRIYTTKRWTLFSLVPKIKIKNKKKAPSNHIYTIIVFRYIHIYHHSTVAYLPRVFFQAQSQQLLYNTKLRVSTSQRLQLMSISFLITNSVTRTNLVHLSCQVGRREKKKEHVCTITGRWTVPKGGR